MKKVQWPINKHEQIFKFTDSEENVNYNNM